MEVIHEGVWFDKWRYDDAERTFYEKKCAAVSNGPISLNRDEGEVKSTAGLGSLASQIAKARQEIQNSLAGTDTLQSGANTSSVPSVVLNRINKLEEQNSQLHRNVVDLQKTIDALCTKFMSLESSFRSFSETLPSVHQLEASVEQSSPTIPATLPQSEAHDKEEEDDDVDLFGSDDEQEDEEAARVRAERLKAYEEKKAKKPGPVAKSSVLLDCKPWADETDMKVMEQEVRKIEMDGLTWGAAKLVPLAYGINKLTILCTIEDEKVSVDDLTEKITAIEDYVQSVDIGAFNKI